MLQSAFQCCLYLAIADVLLDKQIPRIVFEGVESMDCHGVRGVLFDLTERIYIRDRYCSGGSCSDLVRSLSFSCVSAFLYSSLDEARCISRGIHSHHRPRATPWPRISASRGKASPRHQRCVITCHARRLSHFR